MFMVQLPQKSKTCKILTFFEDLSFLDPRSHLKGLQTSVKTKSELIFCLHHEEER